MYRSIILLFNHSKNAKHDIYQGKRELVELLTWFEVNPGRGSTAAWGWAVPRLGVQQLPPIQMHCIQLEGDSSSSTDSHTHRFPG